MSFETFPQTKQEPKMEGRLDVLENARNKIREKSENPEIKKFFNEKDKENEIMLNSHSESRLKNVFEISRKLMHIVKNNSDIIINGKPNHFFPNKNHR